MARPTNEERERRAQIAAAQAQVGDSATVEAVLPASGIAVVTDHPLDLDEDIARIRAMRDANPFGAYDQKMKLAPIQGYKLHWFNDKPGRVETAKRAGWTPILDHEGKPVVLTVDGNGLKAYAMKIPEQFWAEDQARQNAKAEAALAAVKKKPAGAPGQVQASDKGAFYVPEGRDGAATITRA